MRQVGRVGRPNRQQILVGRVVIVETLVASTRSPPWRVRSVACTRGTNIPARRGAPRIRDPSYVHVARESRRKQAGAGGPGRHRGLSHVLCYPLPRRGVRVVDGAALEKRCAKAPRVRIPPSPPHTRTSDRSVRFLTRARHVELRLVPWSNLDRFPVQVAGTLFRGRGRLVDYGAALEMRFGATRRGFESRPLRHLRRPGGRPRARWLLRSSLTGVRARSLRSSQPPSRERPPGRLRFLAARGRPWVRWPAAVLAHARPSALPPEVAGSRWPAWGDPR
jgi:hypothetical protein